MFLSLVRPERISSPITSTAAVITPSLLAARVAMLSDMPGLRAGVSCSATARAAQAHTRQDARPRRATFAGGLGIALVFKDRSAACRDSREYRFAFAGIRRDRSHRGHSAWQALRGRCQHAGPASPACAAAFAICVARTRP